MISRLSLAAGIAALIATPLAALDITAMNPVERDAFRAEIRAYLMENPEVLLEAIKVLEDRQAAEKATGDVNLVRDNSDSLFNDGYSWVGGNPGGDVTIVEFLDYRCTYCRRAHPEVTELIAADGNIRYIVKEFPILGDQSVLAAKFAISVKQVEGDEAYANVHDQLMGFRGAISEASLTSLSDSLDFDTEAVMATMESDGVKQVIDKNHALGQALQINGTPTFVFGEQMLRGYVPLDGMRQVVEEVRAN